MFPGGGNDGGMLSGGNRIIGSSNRRVGGRRRRWSKKIRRSGRRRPRQRSLVESVNYLNGGDYSEKTPLVKTQSRGSKPGTTDLGGGDDIDDMLPGGGGGDDMGGQGADYTRFPGGDNFGSGKYPKGLFPGGVFTRGRGRIVGGDQTAKGDHNFLSNIG